MGTNRTFVSGSVANSGNWINSRRTHNVVLRSGAVVPEGRTCSPAALNNIFTLLRNSALFINISLVGTWRAWISKEGRNRTVPGISEGNSVTRIGP